MPPPLLISLGSYAQPLRVLTSRNLFSILSWWFSAATCCTYLIASARIEGLSVLGSFPGSMILASSVNLRREATGR